MPEKLTKKELKELRKLEQLDKEKAQSKNSKTTVIIISALSILFLGFFSFLVISSKKTDTQNVEITKINTNPSDQVRGNKNAKVTIVEFSDFQCPACKFYAAQTDQLLKDYDGKVKLIYKYYPLPIHQNAMLAAQAAQAAGKQGKFWEMHDLLFANQEKWSEQQNAKDFFVSYSKDLGLDEIKFTEDFSSTEIIEKINADKAEGDRLSLEYTPTFYINGLKLTNTGKYEDFKKAVDDALK